MLKKIETKTLDYARLLSRALRAIRCANVRSGILPPQSAFAGMTSQDSSSASAASEWRARASANQRNQPKRTARQRRTDQRRRQHVARIVQPEHDARSGDEQREWDQQRREQRKIRECYDSECHRVQRVSRRKTELIERQHVRDDVFVRAERTRATRPALEAAIHAGRNEPGQRHLQCGYAALRAAEQRDRKHQRVPEHAVTEAADRAEETRNRPTRTPAIGAQAQAGLAAAQFDVLPQLQGRHVALPCSLTRGCATSDLRASPASSLAKLAETLCGSSSG